MTRLKIFGGILAVILVGALLYGRAQYRQAIEDIRAEEALNALDRISEAQENNADFLELGALERCLRFADFSDSLQSDQCHERFGVSVRPVQ